jgi:hypothetical protein
MTSVEYASLSWLRGRVADTNGCDHGALNELRRRELSERCGIGGGRDPRQLLREMELRRHPDGSPRDPVVATYARLRHTRDPRLALLATWAMKIDGGW